MRIIKLINMQFRKWDAAVKDYLSKTIANYNSDYNNNTILGQLINVLGGITQNVLSYIEDALTEQNKYTATRKRSIYNLAALSGYEPSLGTATSTVLKLSFLPTNNSTGVIIPNLTTLTCLQNGLTYNIMLPQESIVMNMSSDGSYRYVTAVEGTFETQTFTVDGGELYTINVMFTGDCDLKYLDVTVNGKPYERKESLYDCTADGEQYVVKNSFYRGIDIIFGNDANGRALQLNDEVKVTYLLHDGELGNINPTSICEFSFDEPLLDITGESIDGNSMFNIEIVDKQLANNGTYSESMDKVQELIGYNSRSLVLADAKNYKQYLSRFSFVGYNRTWVEEGSLVVNSIVMRNFKNLMSTGTDYFNLLDSDFVLNDYQIASIQSSLEASGNMLAGSVYNILTPDICKYAAYIYIKLKDNSYDRESISDKIKNLIGEFFADINSDRFIPKSDIVKLIKDNCKEVDSVDVYFFSEINETAKKNDFYIEKTFNYNIATGTYSTNEKTIRLYNKENPMLGLDAHGNILLESDYQFPVLTGKFNYYYDDRSGREVQLDPVTIIYQ